LPFTDHRSPRPNPQQRRSTETVAKILETAALLLDEVGFDKVTTNLVCERAGLTPPALYRHFPNKYAVMEELGRRLMAHQNAGLSEFLATEDEALLSQSSLSTMLLLQYSLTSRYPGGRWIMRSLHSSPGLIDVRLKSHNAVASDLLERHVSIAPIKRTVRLQRAYRMAVEIGYASMELLLDEPELDPEALTADAALMIDTLLSSASVASGTASEPQAVRLASRRSV